MKFNILLILFFNLFSINLFSKDYYHWDSCEIVTCPDNKRVYYANSYDEQFCQTKGKPVSHNEFNFKIYKLALNSVKQHKDKISDHKIVAIYFHPQVETYVYFRCFEVSYPGKQYIHYGNDASDGWIKIIKNKLKVVYYAHEHINNEFGDQYLTARDKSSLIKAGIDKALWEKYIVSQDVNDNYGDKFLQKKETK